MEDAATAEICRAQVWQWVKHGKFPAELVNQIVDQHPGKAAELYKQMMTGGDFQEFLTLPAYNYID